jgi:cobalt-zinc-cadmium resistance protein CzcA
MNVTIKEAETKKMVRQSFYLFLYLKQKEKLLLKNDSMYANFLEKATMRFNKGESNVLEKATAESQRGTIAIQLKQLQQDIDIAKLQFKLLLNTLTDFVPTETDLKLNLDVNADNTVINQHTLIEDNGATKKDFYDFKKIRESLSCSQTLILVIII